MHGIAAGPPILLTGATGYVGGRLLHALLERGERIRCLARRPEALPSAPGLEVVAGDVLDANAVRRALDGVETAYYLIHSLGSSEFEDRDRRAAATFARAAREAGVARIVYLGGLGEGPTSRAISQAGRRSGASSPRPASRRSSSGPRSCSVPAASRSR